MQMLDAHIFETVIDNLLFDNIVKENRKWKKSFSRVAPYFIRIETPLSKSYIHPIILFQHKINNNKFGLVSYVDIILSQF